MLTAPGRPLVGGVGLGALFCDDSGTSFHQQLLSTNWGRSQI